MVLLFARHPVASSELLLIRGQSQPLRCFWGMHARRNNFWYRRVLSQTQVKPHCVAVARLQRDRAHQAIMSLMCGGGGGDGGGGGGAEGPTKEEEQMDRELKKLQSAESEKETKARPCSPPAANPCTVGVANDVGFRSSHGNTMTLRRSNEGTAAGFCHDGCWGENIGVKPSRMPSANSGPWTCARMLLSDALPALLHRRSSRCCCWALVNQASRPFSSR